MKAHLTPKQARLWVLVLLGAIVVLVGALSRDATLMALGSGLLGVPALMGGESKFDVPDQPTVVGEPDQTDVDAATNQEDDEDRF
jgi:CO dehydrogenase/acetyl-CoA synthase alpha subunit